jgi:hypothetical protein
MFSKVNIVDLLDKMSTIRETATATLGGQSFSFCLCNSKISCQTSRCACLKKKINGVQFPFRHNSPTMTCKQITKHTE